MCGITGIIKPKESIVDKPVLLAMARKLKHRGPDGEGVWAEGPVGFGHTRLSIIDLTPTGDQPMSFADRRVWLTYNGEVYNFKELRRILESKGVSFRGTSDTEVIGEAYLQWGIEAINRFRGMFAFGLWDGRSETLYLVRDRVGIKPLYYYWDGSTLLFGSEIKSILAYGGFDAELNPEGLGNYLAFGCSVAPFTIYKNIQKVLPGHYIRLKGGMLTDRQYWDIPGIAERGPSEGSEVSVSRLREALEDAVCSHLVADVPVGAFLSGGTDSAAVVAFMAKNTKSPVSTFTIGFKEGKAYDETVPAKAIARTFGCDHHEIFLGIDDLKRAQAVLNDTYDEPFGDQAAFPTLLLSEFARKSVKVVLTGEGGDELFGGYPRYLLEMVGPLYRSLPGLLTGRLFPFFLNALPRAQRAKRAVRTLRESQGSKRCADWLTYFDSEMLGSLLRPEWKQEVTPHRGVASYRDYYLRSSGLDPVNRTMYVDFKILLPDLFLEKVDRASMSVGLEARVPFLDHLLIEEAFAIPGPVKLRIYKTKWLLRKVLAGVVSEDVLKRPKHGFAVPTDLWFRGDLKGYFHDTLFSNHAHIRQYFDMNTVEKIFQQHEAGREVRSWHLWLLVCFELWCHQNLQKRASS